MGHTARRADTKAPICSTVRVDHGGRCVTPRRCRTKDRISWRHTSVRVVLSRVRHGRGRALADFWLLGMQGNLVPGSQARRSSLKPRIERHSRELPIGSSALPRKCHELPIVRATSDGARHHLEHVSGDTTRLAAVAGHGTCLCRSARSRCRQGSRPPPAIRQSIAGGRDATSAMSCIGIPAEARSCGLPARGDSIVSA